MTPTARGRGAGDRDTDGRPGTLTEPRIITPSLLREWELPAPAGAKSSRGQALIVGGARKTPGAPMLAGVTALRMGAGRLSIACAQSVAIPVAVEIRESGVIGLPEDAHGSIIGAVPEDLLASELDRADCVLIGPGLDDAEGATALLDEIVPRLPAETRIVLDAFGFTVLPQAAAAVRKAVKGRLVAHCNGGELARLVERDEVPDEEVPAAVADVAHRFAATVTCQGWIVAPDGGTWHTSTGDTGLGTSGSGDVLAGAVTGLLSRGAAPHQAAVWATHVHAASGDILAARFGRVGYLASELLPELPQVLSTLRGD